ncbi:hypothetical protein VTJ49DRAFT_3435 [Mycothermus thermophilus]|uniref:Uncharacterized protein n=1 Tax=Humicola insolens TaxID=85995 RepID=A0ABR3V7H4_HUMIN
MFRYALRRGLSQRWRDITRAPVACERLLGRSKLSGPQRIQFQTPSDGTRRLSTVSHGSLLSNDTIYALSSGSGRAGIAVIRISGPGCLDVYKGLCPGKAPPKARYAGVRTLFEPGTVGGSGENILDSDALVLYFPAPKTVTGEDVLELHIHGGHATVKAVLSAIRQCSSLTQIRYAEPGEFTKRAFLNARLDLAQVESLGDTLAAETEHQRRAAVRGNSGILGKTYDGWRDQLLLARGEMEALIDFSEDQHFEESPTELLVNVERQVEEMLQSIRLHKLGSQRSELLRNGIRIALLGPPNVGKSSLMNQIVGREASIVSDEAGTTRDVVEASLDIRGYLCSFADTAGIRTKEAESARIPGETIGAIEEEGIRRARQKALESDVIIVLASVEAVADSDNSYRIHYDSETLQLAAGAQQCLIAVNKSDVVNSEMLNQLIRDFKATALAPIPNLRGIEPLTISCKAAASGKTDDGGIHELTERLAQSFRNLTSLPEDMQHLLGVTERQNQLLSECERHLEDFMAEARGSGLAGDEPDIVFAAEHLRLAALRLAAITGRGEAGDVEEVLGVIFEK